MGGASGRCYVAPVREFVDRGGLWVAAQGIVFAAVAAALWWGASGDGPVFLLAPGLVVTMSGIALAADGAYRIRRHITALPAPVAGAPLVERGSYRLARHPIYGGLVVAAVGLALALGSFLGVAAAIGLGAFFLLKSRHEERLLEAAYPEYSAYRSRVSKRLIPWVI